MQLPISLAVIARFLFISVISLFLNSIGAVAQSFGPQNLIGDRVRNVSSIFPADLDGDLLVDVLYMSSVNDIIGWNRNLGAGLFDHQSIIESTADGLVSLDIGDVDADGDLDVVCFSANDTRLLILENLGGGVFGPELSILLPGFFYAFVNLADIDNDGSLDIVVSESNSSVVWLRNLGGLVFDVAQVLVTLDYATSDVVIADLNNDTKEDLILTNYAENEILWYENLGSGVFSIANTVSGSAGWSLDVHVHDMNGDGTLDVLSANNNDSAVVWYQNFGGGVFSSAHTIDSIPYAIRVTSSDFDADGDVDVFYSSLLGSTVKYVESLGGGLFAESITIDSNSMGYSSYATLAIGDLDNDSQPDLLHSTAIKNDVLWNKNLGGTFAPIQNVTGSTYAASQVLNADLDNDGLDDILCVVNNGCAWFPTSAMGEVLPYRNIEGIDEVQRVFPQDLNGDGLIDIAAIQIGGNVYKIMNLGGGVFDTPEIIGVGEYSIRAVHSADLNGDGHADIFVCGTSDTIRLFPNLGGGTFGPMQVIASLTSTDRPGELSAADLDGDGDIDVISGNYNSGVGWFENIAGSFGPQQLLEQPYAGGTEAVFPADFDGDGDIDIAAAHWAIDRVVWYQNLGGGVFDSMQIINPDVEYPSSIFCDDFDGDGDIDLLGASRDENTIFWHKNLSGGNWGVSEEISNLVEKPTSVFAMDLDNDGDMEALSASPNDNKLAWYENLGTSVCGLGIAPSSPSSIISSTAITLSWNPVTSSLGCQLIGQSLVPSGSAVIRNIPGPSLSGFTFPISSVPTGSTFSWKVRCACSISPLGFTSFSPTDTFITPLLRSSANNSPYFSIKSIGNALIVDINLDIEFDNGQSGKVNVFDLAGRQMYTRELPLMNGVNTLKIPTNEWVVGIYLFEFKGAGNQVQRRKVYVGKENASF